MLHVLHIPTTLSQHDMVATGYPSPPTQSLSPSFFPRASIGQFFPALANATPTQYQLSFQIKDGEVSASTAQNSVTQDYDLGITTLQFWFGISKMSQGSRIQICSRWVLDDKKASLDSNRVGVD